MTREFNTPKVASPISWDGIARSVLSAVGGYLIGRFQWIDAGLWDLITGLVFSVIAAVWSWHNKQLTLEGIQGVLRNLFITAGGFFTALGSKLGDFTPILMSLIPVIGPFIYGWLSRLKSIKLNNGEISIHQLKKK